MNELATAGEHEVDEKIKCVFGQGISLLLCAGKTFWLERWPPSPCFSSGGNESPNKKCPPEGRKYVLRVEPLLTTLMGSTPSDTDLPTKAIRMKNRTAHVSI